MMSTKSKVITAMAAFVLLGVAGAGFSQSMMKDDMMKKGMDMAATAGFEATVEGDVYCLCSNIVEAGDKPKCENQNALMVSKVTGKDGKDHPELVGRVLHFLKTPKGKELMVKDNMGKKAKVEGKVYPALSTLWVKSFELKGKGSDMKGGGSDMK